MPSALRFSVYVLLLENMCAVSFGLPGAYAGLLLSFSVQRHVGRRGSGEAAGGWRWHGSVQDLITLFDPIF